jgi:hypothetical protein
MILTPSAMAVVYEKGTREKVEIIMMGAVGLLFAVAHDERDYNRFGVGIAPFRLSSTFFAVERLVQVQPFWNWHPVLKREGGERGVTEFM